MGWLIFQACIRKSRQTFTASACISDPHYLSCVKPFERIRPLARELALLTQAELWPQAVEVGEEVLPLSLSEVWFFCLPWKEKTQVCPKVD